ncbi:MAG: glycoside hydrolase family 92 protein, partial [Mariniphaga sp.]|nr:glycoside hydrolase family 92 protein [Mariniphaga sp.]
MKITLLILSLLLGSCSFIYGHDFTQYVNPFIGTGAVDQYSHAGNNFPGATLPFGFVQLSPDNKDYPDNPCSGYDYNNKTIVGFSHTHLSGTGVEDLFDVMLMPAIGDIKQANTNPENAPSGYSSNITHDQEKAKPGYYQVNLLDYKINVELTATEHAGFHRYTFPKSSESHILIDMNHSIPKTIDWLPCRMIAQIKIIDSVTVEGYRITTGWVKGYRRVYFRAEFSKPFKSFAMINGTEKIASQQLANGECVKTLLDFNTAEGEQIFVKVGLSATSNENAHLNLRTELPGWDFDKTCREAENKWENELRKIMVKGTKEQMEIFYTAMYHAFTQPNNIADVNGDYPATDMTTKNAPDKQHYSTFSLWDTYRAAHPLYALIQQERTASFVNSMIRQKKTFGFLPIWQLWGLENYCMIGNHAIPVIVDAVNKNIQGIDIEEAYEAVKASSLVDHPYSPFTVWEKFGYIPEDILSQSVSITLEMAFDDWCVAQFAKKLGKTDDYIRFIKRANFYKNLYDKQTNFFRAKDKNGNWLSPFNPFKYGDNGNSPYTEANAWQYLFHVPQDVNGLIGLMGGPNAFIAKLDSFFSITAGMSEKN